MAVLSDSVPKEKIRSPKPKKKESDSQQGNVSSELGNNSDGTRVVGGRIYDPVNGKTCHQCRHKTRDLAASCQNQKSNNRSCTITLCHKCLLNRYGEKADEVSASGGWSCPKCRGICNCSVCMKKRGRQPTGILINMAKATGFSSVSEMLLKGRECSNNQKLVKDVATSKQDIVLSPRNSGKENSFEGKVDANMSVPVDKKSKKIKGMSSVNDNVAPQMVNQGPDKKKIKRKEHDCNTNGNEIGTPGSQKKPKKMKRDRSSDMLNGNHVENDSKQASGHNDEKKPKKSRIDGLGDHDTSGKTDSILASSCPIRLEACDKMPKRVAKQNRGVDFEENVNSGITLTKQDSVETSGNDKKKEAGGCGVNNKKFLKNLNRQDADVGADNLLPPGKDLTSVAGIDVNAEDVANALQFLEFCAVFGKILEVKKGQPECVLRDLFNGRTARRGKFSVTVQFHIHLLSILLTEQGNQSANLSPSYGKNSWFNVLKKSLSESLSNLKVKELDFLEKAADYESLDASKKLRILNFLCDEFLGTEKLRNWIDDKTTEHTEKIKEGKQKVLIAKDEEKSLKQRMKDEIAKATAAKNGDHLSISELEAIASQFKSETAEAHAKLLMSQDLLSKNNHACHALRVEPIFTDSGGDAYWKLNYSGKSDILRQNFGKGNSLTSGEKWFVIDAEGREMIKKHIVSLGRKRLRAPRVHRSESSEVEEIGSSS